MISFGHILSSINELWCVIRLAGSLIRNLEAGSLRHRIRGRLPHAALTTRVLLSLQEQLIEVIVVGHRLSKMVLIDLRMALLHIILLILAPLLLLPDAGQRLKQLLDVHKFDDHYLHLSVIHIDHGVLKLLEPLHLLIRLLIKFPGTKTSHQLGIILNFVKHDSTLLSEYPLETTLHILAHHGLIFDVSGILEFLQLLHSLTSKLLLLPHL